jgi:glutamate 5-kinase
VQDAVQLCDDTGAELARALVNFSSEDLDKIVKGRLWRSSDMAQPLGYGTMEEVAHR